MQFAWSFLSKFNFVQHFSSKCQWNCYSQIQCDCSFASTCAYINNGICSTNTSQQKHTHLQKREAITFSIAIRLLWPGWLRKCNLILSLGTILLFSKTSRLSLGSFPELNSWWVHPVAICCYCWFSHQVHHMAF
jgi:hypothetical protein